MTKTLSRCFSLALALVMLLATSAAGFPVYAEGEQQEVLVTDVESDEDASPGLESIQEPPSNEFAEITDVETPVEAEQPAEEPAEEIPTADDLTDPVPAEQEPEPTTEEGPEPTAEDQPDEPPVDESLYDRFHVWSMDDEISMTGTIELLDAEGNLIQALTWGDETVTVPNVVKLVFHAPKERPRVVLQLVRSKEYELLSYEEYKDGEAVEIEPMTGTLYELWFGRAEEDVEARKEESLPTRGTKNLRGASSPYDSRWDNVTVGQQLTDYPWKLTGTTTVPGQWGGNNIDWWNEGGAAAFYFSVADGTLRDREVSLWITDSWSEYRYAWNRDYICSHSHGYCLWGGKAIPRTGWIGTAFLKITKIENGWAYFDYSWLNESGGVYWEDYQAVGGHGKYRLFESGNPISLSKTSAQSGMTTGNSCYYLAGAVYGIYADYACTTELERITTNANGYAETNEKYAEGSYYIKELTPSPGYLRDTRVHTLTLDASGNCTVDIAFTEQPTDDPEPVVIRKTSNGASFLISDSSAVFKVEFWPNSNWSGSPSRTWYYKTVNGVCQLGNEAYLDAARTNSARWHTTSGAVTFPLGILRISEVEAPAGYIKTNAVMEVRISQDTTGGSGIWHWITPASGEIHYLADGTSLDNAPAPGQIDVLKRASNGTPMGNCQFLLEYSVDGGTTWAPVFAPSKSGDVYPGTCSSPGLVNGVLITGSDGHALFTGLIADDSTQYRLTELSTLNGKQLLSEPIELGTLPLLDGTEGPTREVEIVNSTEFYLPRTGGHGFTPLSILPALCALGAALILRKKYAQKLNKEETP